jgi:DNA-nicking Smr family endonuclease
VSKKPKPWNSALEEKLRALQVAEKEAAAAKVADAAKAPSQAAARPPARGAAPGPGPKRAAAARGEEEDLWASAVAGVSRLDPGHGLAAPPEPAGPQPFRDADLDALEELRALVEGDRPFDVADTEEFIEGWVSGLDHGVVRRLRKGDYAVQGHFDLHGMTKDEAKEAAELFLRNARSAGKRCVLLVHGRGLHSKDQVPVLKEALKRWLATARFAKHVLAFATARPQDGGAGAVYVLLRKLGK